MKKIPYGISNYERLIENDYYYVDKTMYIEKLENIVGPYVMFLRPRKFGKTLFTSTLENYYDLKKVDKFESLYRNTYIGKNPTRLKNSYHILKFNFSGIDTSTKETTILSFKNKVISSIKFFVQKYNIDFFVNSNEEVENILDDLIKAFKIQRSEERVYIIIDEYDYFANDLLELNTNQFRNLITKSNKIKKWYEILKEGTESVIDRIFITGILPITLDSLISGFNIELDITQDREFNEMIGFTEKELRDLMSQQSITGQEQKGILPIIKDNYSGYKFSIDGKEEIYNSNMCLYFLNNYMRYKEVPKQLTYTNMSDDYTILGRILDLLKREKFIEQTLSGEGIINEIRQKFNPIMKFTDTDLISMLYYLGYLTITGEVFEKVELKIPNIIIKEIYSKYFLKNLRRSINF